MREILFRGKTSKGDWVYGHIGGNRGCPEVIFPFNDFIGIKVIPETVGQFTGLTDKIGKKIFEGDIIRYADIDEYRCYLESLECPEDYEGISFDNLWTIDEVVYGIKIGYPAFDLNNHDWDINGLSCLNDSGQYFYEVIGNRWDKPELLGEQYGK